MRLGGLLKPRAVPLDDSNVLRQLMKDRDTRWYAGKLLKVNLIIVSASGSLQCRTDLTLQVLPPHHFDE